MAVSCGGYESLMIPFTVVRDIEPDKKSFVRVHIGLEDPELLKADLDNARKYIQRQFDLILIIAVITFFLFF